MTPTHDDLEEELEGTKPPEPGTTPTQKQTNPKHTDKVKTHTTTKVQVNTHTTTKVRASTPITEPTAGTRSEKTREIDDKMVAMLAQDEADLEEEGLLLLELKHMNCSLVYT